MALIYRGETRFDLKGTNPVKLPLVLNDEALISCLVESKQAKPSWRYAGDLEQFAFLPELGNTVLKIQRISFGNPQLFELVNYPVSYLRFTPVTWLKFRTNITIKEIESMPIYQSAFPSSIAITASTTVANIPLISAAITSTQLLPANPARLGFSITNTTSKILYVDYDGTSLPTDYAVAIPSGGYFEPPVNYTGAVHGVWSAVDAGKGALVREFT